MSPAYRDGRAERGVPPELLELSKAPRPGPGRRPLGSWEDEEGGGRKNDSWPEVLLRSLSTSEVLCSPLFVIS